LRITWNDKQNTMNDKQNTMNDKQNTMNDKKHGAINKHKPYKELN